MTDLKTVSVLALVCVVGGCSTSAGSSGNAGVPKPAGLTGPAMPTDEYFPHAGIYDMVTIGEDSLPVTERTETGEELVIERTWMRLTSYGTVEWYQYSTATDGEETYQIRVEHSGEWVMGSKPNSGSVIWGWSTVYVDDQLAEAGNMPDSDEYTLTAEGLRFVSTGSVYRRR